MTRTGWASTGAVATAVGGASLVLLSALVATGAHALAGGAVSGVDVALLVAVVQVLLLHLLRGRGLPRAGVLAVGQVAFHLALGSGATPADGPVTGPVTAGHVHALPGHAHPDLLMLLAHGAAVLVLWAAAARTGRTLRLLRRLGRRLLPEPSAATPGGLAPQPAGPAPVGAQAPLPGLVAARSHARRGPPPPWTVPTVHGVPRTT